MPWSMARSLRAVSSARSSWDSPDLTWTARNQPVRTIGAMARASVRPVLTGMKPRGQWTGLQARTGEDQASTVQGRHERVGLARDPERTSGAAGSVPDRDAARLRRDVDPGMAGHLGASSSHGLTATRKSSHSNS